MIAAWETDGPDTKKCSALVRTRLTAATATTPGKDTDSTTDQIARGVL